MKFLLVVIMILLVSEHSNAQGKTVTTNGFWLGYYNNISISNRWSFNADIQARTRDWTDQFSQALIRSGLSYKATKNISLTAGAAWFKNAEYVGERLILKNEFRPWQELGLQHSIAKNKMSHRLRYEQRFMQQLQDGEKSEVYDKFTRLRYKVDFQYPLTNSINLVLANEIMVHPEQIDNKRFFDQNRLSAAINWKVSQPVALQWQYMKIYQSRKNATIMEDQNVFRFIVYHQINFKKQ